MSTEGKSAASEKKCRHCGKAHCWDHCQDQDDGKHKGDPKSIVSADGMRWVVDVNCLHCGQSGSTRINPKEIQWD